jgi:hypothetical protein
MRSLCAHGNAGFRLQAPGQRPQETKRFPISAFALTPLLAIFLLLAARPAAAITRHDGTGPRFEESFVSKLPKEQQVMWKGVASGERGTLPFSR